MGRQEEQMATFGEDEVIFPSGRKMYANNGIVGLSPDGTIYEGYDGSPDELHPEDRKALARTMIKAWTAVLEGP